MADDLYYVKDGVPYPRESRILDILKNPDLEAWRKRVGDDKAEEVKRTTANAGTKVHALAAHTLKARLAASLHGHPRDHKMPRLPSKPSADLATAWPAWVRWYEMQPDSWVPDVIEGLKFCDGQPRLAGTVDCAETRTRTITDWKITGRISDKMVVQLHFYADCLGWAIKGDGPVLPEWMPPLLRIVRIDSTLGIAETREFMYDHKIMQTARHLARVYTAWFFEPMLAAEREQARLEAEQGLAI